VNAIDASGLTKEYRGLFRKTGHLALRGIELSVPEGAAFGLIGPNGAGKTTFIKLLLGVCRPTAGTVRVLGGSPDDPRIRARIGYMPERLHLPGAWTPAQFLASVSRLKGLHVDRRALDALVERVGLGASATRRIGGFSKGMRQRCGLAAAMLGRPELLILDEPTDGVDPLGRVEVRKLLAEEHARGCTVFLNSHLLAETEKVCQRVGILSGGRIVREGPLDELRAVKARWRVRFAPGFEAAGELGFLPADAERHWIEAADVAQLNVALDAARARGALLVELHKDERDLESVLQDAVTPEAAAAGRAA
jgi:ABC-2 type transport system ATP-binding protein